MITNIFQNVKLSCPITGNPQPLIEWTKNGETIDFTWTRYKTNTKKGFLKILKPLDSDLDSGVFICKGINGFGTEQVTIELIVTGIFLSITHRWLRLLIPFYQNFSQLNYCIFHLKMSSDTCQKEQELG